MTQALSNATAYRPTPRFSGRMGAACKRFFQEICETKAYRLQKDQERLSEAVDQFEKTTPPEQPELFRDTMRGVLADVRLYRNYRDHVGGLYALDEAKEAGLLAGKQDVALINVDSHSDLYNLRQNPESLRYGIANWVNGCIVNHPEITEFVWVMPPELAATVAARKKPDRFKVGYAVIGATEACTMYVDRTRRRTFLNETPPDFAARPERYETVTIRLITADQLPDFKDRDVYLSMDMDYFSNLGHDTVNRTQVKYRGSAQVQELFETLADAHIKPFLVSTATSPEYSHHLPKCYKPTSFPPMEARIQGLLAEIEAACNPSPKDGKPATQAARPFDQIA